MKRLDIKQQNVLVAAFLVILGAWLALPGYVQANTEKRGSNSIRGRFSLEILGGYGMSNPSDLNRFVDADNSYQNFVYDDYFDYLLSKGSIEGWTKNNIGERKKIKNVLPLGIRVRYGLFDFLAVSIGFQYYQRNHSDDLTFQYNRDEFYDEEYIEDLFYKPYGLSVKAYLPTVGLHVYKHIGQNLTAEAYVFGGPLFAECSYSSDWAYNWYIQGPGYTWLTYESEGFLEYDGSGTGISVEAGGRIGFQLSRRLGFFLEGGYAYQTVSSLSGSGKEINDGLTETWEGEWKTKPEMLTAVWGTLNIKVPTNYQTNREGLENFKLDLSGFRIKVGISWLF
ncbi:MAG: hypothetical protein JXB26_11695 [Candidatus Aminicenantes bacterium]|nr:hypothetical protein [Candidatus Aminicenantes bacterium]